MCNESKRKDFFDCLTELIDCTDNICILIGMRADFRVRLREYPQFAGKINRPYVNVEQLNREEIEEAIIKPAELVGLGIEGPLKQQLINDVEDYPGSLPLLQYTLTELWLESRNQKDEILRLDTYNNLGRIEGTLQKRADEIYNSLLAEEQIVARRIFLELTQVGETTITRRRVRLNELKNSHHSLEILEKVSNTLAAQNARLITKDSDKDSQDVILDVVHEALLRYWTQLRKWKEEYQDAIVTERKIEAYAKEWKENEYKPEYLLQKTRLGVAEEYLDKYGNLGMLDGVAEEYIKKSQELRDRDVREKEEDKKREKENIQRELVVSQELAKAKEKARQAAEKQAKESDQKTKVAVFSSLIVLVLAIFAGYQWRESEIGQIDALRASSESFLLSHRQLEAVNESLQTGQLLINSFSQRFWSDTELGNRVIKTLQEVLYTVEEGNRLQGDSPFYAVAFSPDDQTISTADPSGAVKLWKQDGELLEKPWLKQLSDVSAVAFRPKSQTIATARGHKVTFWNLDGKLLAQLSKPTRGDVSALAFSDDGKMIATASTEEKQQKVGIIQIWNSDNGELLKTLKEDMNSEQMSVAFSPDGQMVAASGWYGATVWKIDGTWHKTLTGQWEVVSAVTFSPDGKMIAGARDKTVKLWQIDSKLLQTKELQTMCGHSDAVWGVSFRSDSQMIASASNDNTVKLWHIDGTLVQTLNGHKGAVRAVAFSHNDKTLASASDDGTVKLWKLGGTSLKALSLSHDSAVYAVAFSPDSKRIITTSGHGMATLWNSDSTMIKTGKWLGGPITRVAFSPNGNTIATAAGDRSVGLWKSDGTELKYLEGHTGEINQTEVLGLSFSPDGKTIATGDVAGSVQLWNTNNGKLLKTLGKLESEVWDVSFSPNGKIIASAHNDGTVKLWQRDGTLPPKTLSGHKRAVVGVAFSHDGTTIASAGADRTVKLWNSDDGSLLHTLSGHSNVVRAVAFSPNDQVIASASNDGTVKLWQRDGKLLKTLSGHEGAVVGVAFSPDGKTIASAGYEDKTVILRNWEENLDLKRLLEHGCAWQRDYLNNNPNGKKNKYLCDGIGAKSDR